LKLPNCSKAIIDKEKLVGYCLNPNHPLGQHKARVFKSVFGIGIEQAEELEAALREAALTVDALATGANEFGEKYLLDFTMVRAERQAIIRSSWIVRFDEDFPRLITCYIL
jgi:hypothetical protein